MRISKASLAVSVAAFLVLTDGWSPAQEEDDNALAPCIYQVNLLDAVAECESAAASLREMQAAAPAAVWTLWQICKFGTSGEAEVCANPRVCTVNGVPGTWYGVRRNGVYIARACLTTQEADRVQVNMAVLATEAFERLEWPGSTVTVQPEGNRTLVNFETIFYTTNSEPITRVIELAGRLVTIEATPVSYAWDFGDGSGETTQSPGHPHPNEDVTHVYGTADPVSASVATTYSGRFRVGDGEWHDIEETRTIPGVPVGIEVLEAKPQLVID